MLKTREQQFVFRGRWKREIGLWFWKSEGEILFITSLLARLSLEKESPLENEAFWRWKLFKISRLFVRNILFRCYGKKSCRYGKKSCGSLHKGVFRLKTFFEKMPTVANLGSVTNGTNPIYTTNPIYANRTKSYLPKRTNTTYISEPILFKQLILFTQWEQNAVYTNRIKSYLHK